MVDVRPPSAIPMPIRSAAHKSPNTLRIQNTLNHDSDDSKDEFVPIHPNGKVSFYACGPTVYDDAHLGHARNFVSTDVIRRLLRDYFKYEMKFVMNVTDVDDKIILKARQQYLLDEYKKSVTREALLSDSREAFQQYVTRYAPRAPTTPTDFTAAVEHVYGSVLKGGTVAGGVGLSGDEEAKLIMHIKALRLAAQAIAASDSEEADTATFHERVEDILKPFLDRKLGSTVDADDHSIFKRVTETYEKRFFEDMDDLNVLRPDAIVRVTEHMPQIIEYVETIIRNGFAYTTSDGSVYFDSNAFQAANNIYARLMPGQRDNIGLQAEGEGSLTKKTTEKHSDRDFALWKSSKPGEPSWNSPWGKGRPGWHIECSAMASHHLGKHIDLHSGGIDLAFPHHDNEIAQAEAYHSRDYQAEAKSHACYLHGSKWVKYFLHMGHLSIAGAKMSKSLKNFTTIREALSGSGDLGWTGRSLRIAFLFSAWRDPFELTVDSVRQVMDWEMKLHTFFSRAQNIYDFPQYCHQYRSNSLTTNATHNGAERQSEQQNFSHLNLEKAQIECDLALKDSFNTPKAMLIIDKLISDHGLAKGAARDDDTHATALWVTYMVRTLGLDFRSQSSEQLFGIDNPHETIGWGENQINNSSKPFVYAISNVRDIMRRQAVRGEVDGNGMLKLLQAYQFSESLKQDAAQTWSIYQKFDRSLDKLVKAEEHSPQAFLQLADEVRADLYGLDIYIEDALQDDPSPALIMPMNELFHRVRERKERERAEREAKKMADKAQMQKVAEERAEKAKIRPQDMFKTEEYSQWDVDGIPTKDAEGKDISPSQRKKLKKRWDAQKKTYDATTSG